MRRRKTEAAHAGVWSVNSEIKDSCYSCQDADDILCLFCSQPLERIGPDSGIVRRHAHADGNVVDADMAASLRRA